MAKTLLQELGSADTQRVFTDANGNVGIGIASSGHILHTHKAGVVDVYQHFTNGATGTTTSDGLLVGVNTVGEGIIWNRESTAFRFATSNAERMRITSDGKVGIGTTNPGHLLSIVGNDKQINFGMGAGQGGFLVSTSASQAILSGGVFWNGTAWQATSTAASYVSMSSGEISFGANVGLTSGSTYSPSERMRITGGGNVLVGTSTDGGEKLQVVGSVKITSGMLTANNGAKIAVQDTQDGGAGRGLYMWSATDSAWGIYMGTAGAAKSLVGAASVASLDGRTGHHIRFRVANGTTYGFLWENSVESALMSLTADTGALHTKGIIKADGGKKVITEDAAGDGMFALTTIAKSLTLTTSWQDTGINGTQLTTGSYIVQVFANDNAVGGEHHSEYYTGMMSWADFNTNSTVSDEIVLHRAGHAATGSAKIFLRTLRTLSADAADLKLQIAGGNNNTGASTYTFKFRKII